MEITAFELARRFEGLREIPGEEHNGFIVWAHSLCTMKATTDEIPWCSAWLNAICWMLDLPRTNSAAARSWLKVGKPIQYIQAEVGWDVVVLTRGDSRIAGHVGFYAGNDEGKVLLLGGNQGNEVNVSAYSPSRIIGVRRLYGTNE